MLTDHAPQRLLWDACHNVRDVGGYPTADGGRIRSGALVRADNLCDLSEAGMTALVEYGVRTIIDLRGQWETEPGESPFARPNPHSDSVAYLNLPVIPLVEIYKGSEIEQAETAADLYRVIVDLYPGEIAAVMTAISRAHSGTVLIHCHAGKDRTGLITAIALELAGVPRDVIASDYALSDEYLSAQYPVWLRNAPEDADPAELERLREGKLCPPEAMLEMLTHMDTQYGGVREYLLQAGVDAGDIERIRERLRG